LSLIAYSLQLHKRLVTTAQYTLDYSCTFCVGLHVGKTLVNVNQVHWLWNVNAEYVRFSSRYGQNSSTFDVNIHAEKYHKADVSWNYSSHLEQSVKWQVVSTVLLQ